MLAGFTFADTSGNPHRASIARQIAQIHEFYIRMTRRDLHEFGWGEATDVGEQERGSVR
jgi:hypothetical protein